MTLDPTPSGAPKPSVATPGTQEAPFTSDASSPARSTRTVSSIDSDASTMSERLRALASRRARRLARSLASDAKQAVKDRARRVAGRLSDEMTQTADKQRSKAAGRIRALSTAATCAADSLGERREALQMPVAGAANGIERVAGYLEATDLREIRRDVEVFARKSPRLYVGSALLLGAALGRFLRATPVPESIDPAENPASFDPPGSQVPPLRG